MTSSIYLSFDLLFWDRKGLCNGKNCIPVPFGREGVSKVLLALTGEDFGMIASQFIGKTPVVLKPPNLQ